MYYKNLALSIWKCLAFVMLFSIHQVSAKSENCPRTIHLADSSQCKIEHGYAHCRIKNPAGGFWEGKLYVGNLARGTESEKKEMKAIYLDKDPMGPKGGGCEYNVQIGNRKQGEHYGGTLKHTTM